MAHRFYDRDGTLLIETPMRNGKMHGVALHWYDDGETLQSAEPFRAGLPHGTARQWAADGSLLGTYTLKRGTGLDLWRMQNCEGGAVYLAEVQSLKNGKPHGYEWWLNEDQLSVWAERHWHEGQLHGIEREWNSRGSLRRGYPRYHVRSERVSKRAYFQACEDDLSLPVFREEENEPARSFPSAVARELSFPV